MPRRKGYKARQQRNNQSAEVVERRRLRNPKTPAAQVGSDAAYPDEEEEDVGEGAMRPAHDPPIDDDAVAIAIQLGADMSSALLAVANTSTPDGAEEQRHSKTTAMGANQSHEEVNRNIRNAANRLQKGSGASVTGNNTSGKLRKPSAGIVRRLAPPNVVHRSPYDALLSPERHPTRRKPGTEKTAFSPVRTQRKTRQTEPQSPTSARRSGRVQAQQEAPEAAAPRRVATRRTSEQRVEDVEGDAIYRDRFPDAIVRQHVQAELDAADSALAGDSIEVANHVGDDVRGAVMSDEPLVEKPRKKLGRPPKREKAAEATNAAEGSLSRPDAAAHPSQAPSASLGQRTEMPSSARANRVYHVLAQKRQPGRASVSDEQPERRPGPRTNSKSSDDRVETSRTHPRRSTRTNNATTVANQHQNESIHAGGDENVGNSRGSSQSPMAQPEGGDEVSDSPVILRASELQFDRSDDGSGQPTASEGERSEARTTRKRKRKSTSQRAHATTGAKRRKKADSDDEHEEQADAQEGDEQQHDEADGAAEFQRLWGHWRKLRDIDAKAQSVGCEEGERPLQKKVKLKDKHVKAAHKLCAEAESRYHRLREGELGNESDPASVLTEIAQRIDGLRGRNDDFPTDFESQQKVTDMYAYLLPALASLVFRAATCYEIMDQGDVTTGQMTMTHLQIVQDLILMTLRLETAAKDRYKARPDTKLAVVRVVHDDLAVPLRTISVAFRKILQRHRADVAATQRRQDEAQHRALKLEQEERRSRQAAELQRVRQKWEQLHRERMAAEGGMMRPAKMVHLSMPDPHLDEDFDGNAFDRVSVFHPRVGPPPGLIARAKQIVWTEGQLRALEDGLRSHKGRMVYERIFREWCPRGRMLNRYSVTEIVAAAELVKEYYEAESREQGVEVEEWVQAIPVWSKGHAIGKENEDELVGDKEVADDAAAGMVPAA